MAIEQTRRLKELTADEQAALFHGRERRRSQADPRLGLFRTHRYVKADSGFDVGDAFPVRTGPLTVAVKVERTGASPNGIVFEMGDATTGLAIYFDGTTLGACVGDAGAGGVTLELADALTVVGQRLDIVFSVIPGNGKARLWVNGDMVLGSAAGDGSLTNGFAADSAAGIGEVSGTVTGRVPAGARVTLADISIVSPVSLYRGQRPRNFDDKRAEPEVEFSPLDLSPSFWIDPADPVATTHDGTFLEATDKVGSLVLQQPIDSRNPALTDGWIVLDGINDWLYVDDETPAGINLGSGDHTIVVVVKTSNGTDVLNVLRKGLNDGSYFMWLNSQSSGVVAGSLRQLYKDGTNTVNVDHGAQSLNDGNPHAVAIQRNNTSGELCAYVDGVKLATTGSAAGLGDIDSNETVAFWGKLTVGASASAASATFYFDGSIGDILLFKDALTQEEINDLQTYLAAKWGIV